MNFMGGLSFIAHLLIIITNWIIKKPFHFFIIFIVFIFGSIGFYTIGQIVVTNNNVDFVKNIYFCEDYKSVVDGKKYAILRIDDVQSYYLRDISKKMIDEGLKRKIPFTLGVIPLNLEDDTDIVDYLKARSCNLEMALHGYNHRYDKPEFLGLAEIVASDKIKLGLNVLNKISSKDIVTFIPPENQYSKESAIAIEKKGLKVISSEGKSFFDYSSSTYNYNTYELDSIDNVLDKCDKDTEKKGFCIIMLHPQDYIDDDGEFDSAKYSTYLDLLNRLENKSYDFTTIGDYYSYLNKINPDIKFYDYKVKTLTDLTGKMEVKSDDILVKYVEKDKVSNTGVLISIDNNLNKKKLQFEKCNVYPKHNNIEGSIFWVGEDANTENGFIHNFASAWDENWSINYKKNNENEFYFALPYNDLHDDGQKRENAKKVYWYYESKKSILHDRWVKVTKGEKVAYAQWKDVGPFESDDVDYVFGNNQPKNTTLLKAGIDLSPALAKEIGFEGSGKVDWEFITEECVPDGKWKNYGLLD